MSIAFSTLSKIKKNKTHLFQRAYVSKITFFQLITTFQTKHCLLISKMPFYELNGHQRNKFEKTKKTN